MSGRTALPDTSSGVEPAANPPSMPTRSTPTSPSSEYGNFSIDAQSATLPLVQHPQYPRRAHRKSRTGCAMCKSRKIKCDERHPACLNCISHGVNCPFLSIKELATANTKQSARHSSQPPTPNPTVTPNPAAPLATTPSPSLPEHGSREVVVEDPPLPILELELLHNFITLTYSTLAADPGVCDFWRVTVVQIGLRCDYIMRAVLAISALHLAYHRPNRRDFYTAQGIMLHQRAARSAMQFIVPDGIDNLDDAVNLFLFSMLTIYFALASPRRSLADGSFFIGDIDIDPTTPFTSNSNSMPTPNATATTSSFPDWTFLLNGAKSLSNVLGSQGHSTVLAPFLAYGMGRWTATRDPHSHSNAHSPSTCPPDASSSLDGVDALRRRILAAVLPSSTANAALLATYTHALDELELALVARQDAETPRDVLDAMLWLWEVSDSLVPLLKSHPPHPDADGQQRGETVGSDRERSEAPAQEAVAIFAHFSILLKHHESHWWLQGWADHLISRAYEILDEEHRGWIAWPMREVGWSPSGPK